jgi:hypothetical protein
MAHIVRRLHRGAYLIAAGLRIVGALMITVSRPGSEVRANERHDAAGYPQHLGNAG